MVDESLSEEDFRNLTTKLRFRLSDMGCIEFKQDERRRWYALPPAIASTADDPDSAVLCGARTPGLLSRLEAAAQRCGISIQRIEQEDLPDWICLTGEAEALKRAAAIAEIRYMTDIVAELASRLEPLEITAARAPMGRRITEWKLQFFEPRTGRWEASPINHTVVQCSPTYGSPIYLVEVSRKKEIQMPKREAVFLALAMNNRRVAGYNHEHGKLAVPTYAPLPDRCARLACLASQKCGKLSSGMVEYGPMPERVARFILAAIGQS